jgi:hypothetical protein
MIISLRKADTTAADVSPVSETHREASMIAESAYCRVLELHKLSGRRLRNRIILANAVAWIVIIVVVCVIFF